MEKTLISPPPRPRPTFFSPPPRRPFLIPQWPPTLLLSPHLSRQIPAASLSAATPPPSGPSPSTYSGWDELLPPPGHAAAAPGELDQFRNFLASLGIDDQKHIFVFFLGFVASMAISRVSFSSTAVLPVAVVVFVLGFSVGVSNSLREFVVNKKSGSNSTISEESSKLIRLSDEKLRCLGRFLNELNDRISNLRNGLEAAVRADRIEVSELRRYIENLKTVEASVILPARNLVGTSTAVTDWDFFYSYNTNVSSPSTGVDYVNANSSISDEKNSTSNQKLRKQRRDLLLVGLDFARVLVGGLFLENLSVSWKPKSKFNNGVKQAIPEQMRLSRTSADASQSSHLAEGLQLQEKGLNMESHSNVESSIMNKNLETGDSEKIKSEGMQPNIVAIPLQSGDLNGSHSRTGKSSLLEKMVEKASLDAVLAHDIVFEEAASTSDRKSSSNSVHRRYNKESYLDDDDLGFSSDGLDFRDHHGRANKMSDKELQERDPTYVVSDRIRRKLDHAKIRPAESLGYDSLLSSQSSSSSSKYYKIMVENRAFMSSSGEVMRTVNAQNQAVSDSSHSASEDISSSPTTVSDDEFNYYLEQACYLFKQAREYLTGQADEELAENLLCKSSALLSRAVTIKPDSVSAVGQLGNTLLLRGELKLKISRELRALLTDRFRGSKTQSLTRDKISDVLVDAYEECEQLLIEAGRKYRVALSIDGNDARALYNWGLALLYRGQLLSDFGPEAAFDADKVYLAAIDKFDALMSSSETYAPEALFRWGVALHQRSRLRPKNSKDKMKLLQQAKSLFDDALYLNADNMQVKEALSSCVSELKYQHSQ